MATRKSSNKSVFMQGMEVLLGNVSQKTAQLAAGKIVVDLVKVGPWYSGDFAESWVVKPGGEGQRIKPNKKSRSPRPKKKTERRPVGNIPFPATLRGSKYNTYVIGNEMEYRDIAMDLKPGRVERAKEISAVRDWYRLYTEVAMKITLKEAYDIAIQDPKIRGYKKNILIGPAGRYRR